MNVFSQDIFDWDIDTIFDNDEPQITETEEEPVSILSQIRKRGLYISSDYEISFFVAPGWKEYPWSKDENKDKGYYLDRGILLKNTLTLDAQISEVFRVVSSMSISVPPVFNLALDYFYFDYNFYDRAFARVGRYDMAWGISPNFGFTNLLARVPDVEDKSRYLGESYILKIDYPIGIGGLQLLTLTRGDPEKLEKEDFGFGGKFNFAIPQADFDFGVYYLEKMPFRSFLSIKTTLWKTDFYTEGLIAIDTNNKNDVSGAVNFGFARSFFNDRLSLNGEFFFNGEKNTYKYQAKTDFKDEEATDFIEEFTMAFNLSFKIWERINLRYLTSVLYAPAQKSAHITPGFTFNPWQHFEVILAAPIAVGAKDGYYRTHTPRWAPGDVPLPFAVYLLVRLTGGVNLN